MGCLVYYLLQGLKGEAANAEGDVSINDLAAYTRQKVERWAAEEKGKKQRPWLRRGQTGVGGEEATKQGGSGSGDGNVEDDRGDDRSVRH